MLSFLHSAFLQSSLSIRPVQRTHKPPIRSGLVYTPMVAPHISDDLRQYRANAAPLKSEGTGWDIGYAALFFASDEARWITGICLPVDAGLMAVHPGTFTPVNI